MHELEEQLSLLWRRSRSNALKVARQVHPDMEPSAYGILAILQRTGDMRLTDLAAEIGVGKPSISRQIAGLESLGLVCKHAHPDDGRAQAISLTDVGRKQLAVAQDARRARFHEVLGDWPAADVELLGRLLGRLNDSYARYS